MCLCDFDCDEDTVPLKDHKKVLRLLCEATALLDEHSNWNNATLDLHHWYRSHVKEDKKRLKKEMAEISGEALALYKENLSRHELRIVQGLT